MSYETSRVELYAIPNLEWHTIDSFGNRWADCAFGRIHIHRAIRGFFVVWPTSAVGFSDYMADPADAESWAQETYETELAEFLVRRDDVSAQ